MNMIEVDPKLFITCRLCLDEMGQYQIVPDVQMQIKYCFDIDVEPFDGLPQLLCKKCENILSQYAGIKQMFQEKQSSLKSKLKAKDLTSLNIQQQDTVSSTQQVDSDSNINNGQSCSINNKTIIKSRTPSVDKKLCNSDTKKVKSKTNKHTVKNQFLKSRNTLWMPDYTRWFMCKFCSKTLKTKKHIVKHFKHCHIIEKYSSIIQNCTVKIDKFDSKPNLTSTNENVVVSKDKVVNCNNEMYNIIYTRNAIEKHETSDSSDDDFNIVKKKPKRRRILSKSSTETLVIDNNNSSKNFINSDNEEKEQIETHNRTEDLIDNRTEDLIDGTDIDLVNIDDSDSTSTKSTLNKNRSTPLNKIDSENNQQPTALNDKVLQNIITMCYNKYLKKIDVNDINSKSTENEKHSFLQKKILSLGGKVIHKGVASTGLLRYMEHKNLDITWIPTSSTTLFFKVAFKENKNEGSQNTWKSIKDIDNEYVKKDFIDIFEESLMLESNTENTITNPSRETPHFSQLENKNKIGGNTMMKINNSRMEGTKLYEDIPVLTEPPNDIGREVKNSVLYIRTNPELKILNANPVANPKQLPSKKHSTELFTLLTNSNASISSIDMHPPDENVDNGEDQLSMPIITSTVSLADCATKVNKTNESKNENVTLSNLQFDKPQTQSLPRIKVKPVSELMPEKGLNQQFSAWANMPYPSNVGQNGNVVYMSNSSLTYPNIASNSSNKMSAQLKTNQHPNIVNVSSALNVPSNTSDPSLNTTSNAAQQSNASQYVIMHTIDLPNKRTNSPFRYFQELLQLHNMVLLNSTEMLNFPMTTLINFKLMFQQESIPPVTLCLSLLCNDKTYCIRVKDTDSKYIDIAELSANWQWEILKEFKGPVVDKLYENARKIGPNVSSKTTKFVTLLKSIVFSKM